MLNGSTEAGELKLRFGGEYITYEVSSAPLREATPSEIPIIDIAGIDGHLSQQVQIADEVRNAVESNGFFYIKSHGISEHIIQSAGGQAVK